MYDVVLSFDGAGSLTHRYLHGDAVDQVFASEDALGEVLWALTDNQGTVRDIADYDVPTDALTFIDHRQFDTFGNITNETNPSVDFRYAYTGAYLDPDTGVQNHLHRWYDPQVGRWVSEDPIGFNAGDANLSRYVGNSPTNYTDPRGLLVDEILDAASDLWGSATDTVEAWGGAVADTTDTALGAIEDTWLAAQEALTGTWGAAAGVVEDTWASTVGNWIIAQAPAAAADEEAEGFQGTLTIGGDLDIHLVLVHITLQGEALQFGYNSEDGLTFGQSISFGIGYGLGLSANAQGHLTVTDAPNVGSLQGESDASGLDLFILGVAAVEGTNYHGFTGAIGPGWGLAAWQTVNATLIGYHTGPDGPPAPRDPYNHGRSGDTLYLDPYGR